MAAATLHVVFTETGAGALRQALKKVGVADRVVALSDDLSFGPIDPGDAASRTIWVAQNLGGSDWAGVGAEDRVFWREALKPGRRRVAWLSRRSIHEYCAWLEFLWRLGEAPCEVIDLTDVMLECKPAMSLGMLSPGDIVAGRLIERARPLSQAARKRNRALWARLRRENAALRVLARDGSLKSARLQHFDRRLLSRATPEWRPAAMLVAYVLGARLDRFEVGDLLLFSRLRALAERGTLEARGAATGPKFEVRRPGA